MVLNELGEFLQNHHTPALILSRSRTILAANDAVCRLCSKSPEQSLLGTDVHNLGFTLIAAEHHEHITTEGWDSLLEACVPGPQRSDTSQDRRELVEDDKRRGSRPGDFWDNEERNFPSVADISISYGDQAPTSQDEHPRSWLRARMSIRCLRSEGELMYHVEFHRPMLSGPLSILQTATSKSQVKDSKSDEDNDRLLPPENDSEREEQVHEKVSVNIPYFSALFDSTGQALHFSKSWARVTGMSYETAIGHGWFQAIHPDDRPAMMDAWTKVVKNQENSWTWEARYRRVNSKYYWALIRFEASKKQSRTIDYWYGSVIDVDNLVRTRQESEDRRKAILELVAHTDVCLWGIREDRTLSLQEGSLQWDPMAALNQDTWRTSDDEAEACAMDTSTATTDISKMVEEILTKRLTTKTLEHKDEGRWYRTTLIADRARHVRHQQSGQATYMVLGLTIDITDVRARGDLEVQNEILIARERAAIEASELKSRFVANISHELRTPLAGIIGMNDLLLESLPHTGNDDLRHFSKNVQSSATQLLAVINDVLDLSKIEAGRLELEELPLRICELVDSVVGMIAIQAERKGLPLHKVVDVPSSLVVVGDLNRLHQVLLNLLSNSIKFTRIGSVTLSACVLSSTEDVQHTVDSGESGSQNSAASPTNDQSIRVQFVVEDTGCGMSKTTTEKIFDAFSQADSSTARQHGGTGLGLTICRQLVEMMGGWINFTSELNVGTKAMVIIPFQKTDSEVRKVDSSITSTFDNLVSNVESAAQAYSTSKGDVADIPDPLSTKSAYQESSRSTQTMTTLSVAERSKTLVLIVEDNAVNMKIAVLMVKKLGLQTVTASNGEEALEILDSCAKSQQSLCPNIVLMDCMMPVMDGYKATRNLRRDNIRFSVSTRSIPVIALTASAHKGDQERCSEAGMDDYLIKPVNKKSLEDALVRWTLIGRERLARIHEDGTIGAI